MTNASTTCTMEQHLIVHVCFLSQDKFRSLTIIMFVELLKVDECEFTLVFQKCTCIVVFENTKTILNHDCSVYDH